MDSDEKQIQRLTELKGEFRRLIDFHDSSFAAIDGKARYWLTVTLPAFLGILGVLIEKGDQFDESLIAGGYALSACLFLSTYFFSSTLLSLHVESGVLAPKSRSLSNASDVLESSEAWAKLTINQTNHLLEAIQNNETQNGRKSSRLRKAEVALFRGVLVAPVLAAGAPFAYAAASPFIGLTAPVGGAAVADTALSATTVSAILGTLVGTCTATVLIVFDHLVTLRKQKKKIHQK